MDTRAGGDNPESLAQFGTIVSQQGGIGEGVGEVAQARLPTPEAHDRAWAVASRDQQPLDVSRASVERSDW